MNHLSMARLYCKVLDFPTAERVAEDGLAEAEKSGNWRAWGELASLCLRIYADTLQTSKGNELKERLLQLKDKEIKELASSIHYHIGMKSAQEGKFADAAASFCLAETLAETSEDRGRALFGSAVLPWMQGRPSESLKKLDDLERELPGQEGIATQFSVTWMRVELNDHLGNQGERDRAIERAWEISREDNNPHYVVHNLIFEAKVFLNRKDLVLTKRHIATVERLLPHRGPGLFLRRLDDLKAKVRAAEEVPAIELFRDGESTRLKIGERGVIDVTKMDLLMKLLSLLGENPGQPVSKEKICEVLWREEYHPLRHDNKIYVTIRRLRTLLNDKMDRPELILTKDGQYSLSSGFRFIRFHPASVDSNSNKKYFPDGKQIANSIQKEGRL
jgi:DNA-binding winged helix-turn-helix (wHTH) protein